ncbi:MULTISPECIES: IclR family transcriptional regulator C-terminal domain-containing protein [unclassified Micromonospora]|uniref:IclR family transcriptional regulator domain-containing protein n=1 Tax=unclassified Micromonospora TaxID=2617518 RepID=UPI0012BC4272|nr:IclR family transcriptional regulator C-terminal domain-containing protein [Micromonospora sp. CP22]MTK04454.1 IclR family transcriptional regulator [Micromonospora sp. CP22]
MGGRSREPYFVQSLERGLAVIRAFDATHSELTLSEVARVCDITRATARRFLLTLTDLGYVHTDGRMFRLSPRILELGYSYLSSVGLPEIAQPHLERLVHEVHESSSVCVLDGDDIAYVARVPTSRIMTVSITVGTRFPAYLTSVGRVLLAHLPEQEIELHLKRIPFERPTSRAVSSAAMLRTELARVRAQGYAIVDQELEEGLRSVAAPIRDHNGTVVAAVNIPVHASRNSIKSIRRDLIPPLVASASRIEADLRLLPSRAGGTGPRHLPPNAS